MKSLRRFFTRLSNLVTGSRDDRRLIEEMEDHIAQQAAENIRAGMSATEARRHAVLRFGAQAVIREEYHAETGFPFFETLLRDLSYALRTLRNSPGFTFVVILVLALGIGALTTVATWTNAVLYDPWPHVTNPRAIYFIDATVLGYDGYSVHYDQYRFLHASGRSWKNDIAFAMTSIDLADKGAHPEAVTVGVVTSNYFQFLGISPLRGRFFQIEKDERQYGSNDQIVLSRALWRSRFHEDPSVVGRTLEISGHPFTIVGVAPEDFAGIFGGVAEAAWIPLSGLRDLSTDSPPDPLLHYGLQVAVRLRPGESAASAAAELHTLARTYALEHPKENLSRWDLNLRDAAHFSRGLFNTIGEGLPILTGASVLLIMLVCVNIASLLGQRAARRRREVAIRAALGATPFRVAAQVLTETGLLVFAGGLAGWTASLGMARGLYILLPNFGVPLAFNLHADSHTLLFATALCALVTLACGIYPVRQALRVSQNDALHEGGPAVAGRSSRKLGRQILLGIQLGICFIVLVGCGLLARTALNIMNRNTGFDRTHCLTAQLSLSRAGYTEKRGLAFQSNLLERLRALPGASSATLTSHLPMGDDGSGNTQDFSIPGYVPHKGEEMSVITDFEGPDFFHVMGIGLDSGREFDTHDYASSADVALINESMARRYWPNGGAIGHSVIVGKRPRRIVGIVRDYAYSDPADTHPKPVLFLPLAQNYYSDVILAVRPRESYSTLTAQLRQTLAELDGSLPLEEVRTLKQVTDERYQMARIPAELLGVYAFSSVLVAMIGLYSVMAFSVIERHREFALRIALGSTRAAIFRLVLLSGTSAAVIGLLAGGLGSVFFVQLLRSLLFGITPFDPLSYCAAAAFVVFTIFASGLIPARFAASIEPMRILRSE